MMGVEVRWVVRKQLNVLHGCGDREELLHVTHKPLMDGLMNEPGVWVAFVITQHGGWDKA